MEEISIIKPACCRTNVTIIFRLFPGEKALPLFQVNSNGDKSQAQLLQRAGKSIPLLIKDPASLYEGLKGVPVRNC
jgi:hypothetical protein